MQQHIPEDSALSQQLHDIADENQSVTLRDNTQEQEASRTEGRDSAINTLVRSELIQLPLQQNRPHSQPPSQHTLASSHAQFVLNASQHQSQQVQPSQYRQQQVVVLQPQFQPQWINQPQTTQARMQDQRSRTMFFSNQLQPQMVHSQRIFQNNQNNQNFVRGPVPRPEQRLSTVSPPKINFNYNFTSSQVSPATQPVPQPPPQFIITSPPASQINSVVVWQQRYFLIIERFEFYYTRFDTITQEYIYIQQAIERTNSVEELEALKEKSRQLLHTITLTQQELTETVHQNKALLGEATNWKEKYDQLLIKFNELTQSQQQTSKIELNSKYEQLQKRFSQLNKENQQAAIALKEWRSRYEQLQIQNTQYTVKISEFDQIIHKITVIQTQLRQQTIVINSKDEEIANLRRVIAAFQNDSQHNTDLHQLSEELSQNQKLIISLRQQNDSLYLKIKKNSEEQQELTRKNTEVLSVFENQIQQLNSEIESYRSSLEQKIKIIENLSRLNTTVPVQSPPSINQSVSLENQSELRRLRHEIRVKEETHESDMKIYNGKVEELIDKLRMLGNEKNSIVASLQEKVNLLDSDLTRKDGTIRNLRDRILQLEEQKRIKELDTKYSVKKTVEASLIEGSTELNSIKRQMNEKINEIEELQAQITEYKRITNEYEDSLSVKKHEINNLKRQLDGSTNFAEDITKLNELVNRKNAEIIDLKNRSFQLQKIGNQNELLRQENMSLNEALKRKHGEIVQMNDKIYLFQKKVRDLEVDRDKSPTVVHLNEENELLENANRKKDQEITKLRQSNQLLETNVEELESELQKLKSKLNSGQRLSQNEKNDLRIKLANYQNKFAEFERKIIGLEEVRSILQEQVTTLTTQVHIKIESAQKAQLELKQEKIKVKAFETETDSLLAENEEFRLKMKELDRKYQSLQKEMQAEADKKKELTNTKKSQLFNLNNKCIELQNATKNKDTKIKELEKNIETLNYKIRNMDHNLEEIEYLKHKITEYETKISNMGYQKHQNYRISDIEHTQVFEKKVIYQLKVENEALKKQLGYNQLKNPSRPTSQADIPERDGKQQHVQQRLNDFNQKLESVISDQHVTVQFPNLNHDELYKQYERDRRQLIERHNEEISQLKVKILQLQGQSNLGMIDIKGRKTYANVDSVYNEQLQFYREKNQQLEERVDNHIRVNKELKDSIQLLMRGHNEEYSIHYYKEQIEKSSEVIATLQAKLKKLNEELKRLKEENVRSQSKLITDNNAFESESRITDLTRRINQLTVQISLNEKEKISRSELLEESEKEIKKLRIQMDEFKLWKDETVRNYKEKETNYQDEITKLNNKCRINQSQIERLNEIINKKQGQQSGDLKTLKIKLVELQEENKKYKSRLEELIINEERYQRQITKLENQTKLLQSEIQRLKELTDSSSRKIKEYESDLQSSKILITEYESKLRLKDSNTDAWSYRQSQYQQEITKFTNQIKLLQSEIDRVNEFSQKKLSEKDGEINRWKLVINERNEQISIMEQHINELKVVSYRSNESAQQIFNLKEQINRLKISLNVKTNESDSRLNEISELHHSLEELDEQLKEIKRNSDSKVYDLNSTIGYLEDQNKESKKSYDVRISQLTINIKSLEDQINELNKSYSEKVYEQNSAFYQIEQQLRQAHGINQDLNSHVQYLKLQNENIKEENAKEIASLQAIIDRLNQQLRESGNNNETTIYELNHTIYQLNQQLRELKSNAEGKIYDLNIIIKQLEDHLKQVNKARDEQTNELKGYITHLQQEFNELRRSKDGKFAETDLVIQQLEQKVRVLELANMQYKISIRQLEESNIQLAASNRQLQSTNRQIEEAKRELEGYIRQAQAENKQMEQSIIQLEAFNRQSETSRQQIEFSYRQLSKSYKQMQISYQKLEIQIRQLCQLKDNQINELRQRILYLESHMKEWAISHESEISELKIVIQKLEIQLHELSIHSQTKILHIIRNSRYTIEFMRSSLIQVDVLLTEDTIPRQFLARRINQQIEKALQECSRWNETI